MIDLGLAGFIPTLARTSGFAMTAPLVGDPTTSARVRLVFAVAVAVALTPARATATPLDAAATVPWEFAAGALPGLAARLVLEAAAVGGQLIGLHLGLGFAQSFDPNAGEQANIVRRLCATIAGLAFLAAGGLEAGVRALATPVDPAQLGLELSAAVELALGLTARAVGFAAPVMLAAVVANAALAVLSRAVPALNVFAVSLAAVLVGGGLILVATVPTTAAALDAIAADAVELLAARGGR